MRKVVKQVKELDKRASKLQKEINELKRMYACKQPKTQASVDRLKGVKL